MRRSAIRSALSCLRIAVRRGATVVAALAGAVAVSCAKPAPLPERSFPLVELADSARTVVETDAIDIGDPASRAALWSGWGPDEKYPEGNFVWGSGDRSRLRFEVVEPRDRELRLRGWAFPFGEGPPQEVRFEIGGREIARRKLAAEPGTVEIELPEDALRVGENLLELHYARHAKGDLPWAAGWDTLRFDGPRASAAPRIERGAGRIVLPARTALEWSLELTGGSWLSWKGFSASGTARLAISIVDEDDRREELANARSGRLQLTADGAPYRLHSIVLRALGSSGEIRLNGLRLHAPDLASPPPVTAAAAAAAATAVTSPASPPAQRPNLILYIIDTLRADHLGCYGYRRPTSPAIDAFARDRAVRFQEARAQASWTRPAIATLLTGLQPITHGAQETDQKLADRIETLAERLSAAGYDTAMVTTNGNVGRRFGFGQGFGQFWYITEKLKRAETHARSAEAQRPALDWLAARDATRPFFLVIHTADPHDPYTPSARFRKLFAPEVTNPRIGSRQGMVEIENLPPKQAAEQRKALIDLYDGEIAQNDASFGELVAELARRGLDRSTAVILTADHGEEFFEHGGWKHGQTLYEEQLRIPMLVALPDRRGAGLVVTETVEQIDVTPTFLGLAGIPVPPEMPGRSLLASLETGTRPRPGFTSYSWLSTHGIEMSAAVRSQWKLIENLRPASVMHSAPFELFSLGSDAEERTNLALSDKLRRNWLLAQIGRGRALFGSLHPVERTEIDPELRETLKALGYL